MQTMSKNDQTALVSAVEKAIRYSNQGITPNDAIIKVASECKLTIPSIQRVVETFNKAVSVNYLKEASEEDRAKTFPLADISTVLRSVYGDAPMSKVAAAEQALPNLHITINQMLQRTQALEKTASAVTMSSAERLHAQELRTRLYGQADVWKAVRGKLHTCAVQARYDFHKSLEKAASQVQHLSDRKLRSFAQNVINGYTQTGPQFLRLMSHMTRREIPTLEKTAHAAVFPPAEPYLSLAEVHKTSEKLAAAENELVVFDKEAANFLDTFSGNVMANLVAPQNEDMAKALQTRGDSADNFEADVLDPTTYNHLKELDARRAFMSMVLYDEDFRPYKFSELAKAYNTAVQSVPEAAGNPVILKTLMVKNLESSGIKDVFELAQEQDLAAKTNKASAGRRAEREATLPARKESAPITPAQADIEKRDPLSKTLSGVAKDISAGIAGAGVKIDEERTKKDTAAQADIRKRAEALADKWLEGGGGYTEIRQGNPQLRGQVNSREDVIRDMERLTNTPKNQWDGDLRIRAQNMYKDLNL